MSILRELDDELEILTGERVFLYSTQPSPTSKTRYVFQDRNFLNLETAIEYLRFRIETAQASKEPRSGT